MPRNILFKKGLVVGIIFLFIGVAVAPSTTVDIPNKEDVTLVNDTSENDCNCQPVNEFNLVRLERTLDRLESYTRILSLLSKRYPEIAEEYEELSVGISTLAEINEELKSKGPLWNWPIICSTLEMLIALLQPIVDFLEYFLIDFFQEILPTIAYILSLIYLAIMGLATPIVIFMIIFDCIEFPSS